MILDPYTRKKINIMVKCYERIRGLREDNDLTQKQVAEKLYLQTTVYQRYERGEREIPLCIAIKLAELYNVSLDYLAGLIETPKKLYEKKQIGEM